VCPLAANTNGNTDGTDTNIDSHANYDVAKPDPKESQFRCRPGWRMDRTIK
jgi:hypothetical protein